MDKHIEFDDTVDYVNCRELSKKCNQHHSYRTSYKPFMILLLPIH